MKCHVGILTKIGIFRAASLCFVATICGFLLDKKKKVHRVPIVIVAIQGCVLFQIN